MGMKMRVGVGVEMGGMFPLRDFHLDHLPHIKVQVKRLGGILLEVRVDYLFLLKLMLRVRLLDLGLVRGQRRRGRREVLGRLRRKRRKERKRGELVMPVYVSSVLLLLLFYSLREERCEWANGQRTKKIRCDILSPEEAMGREALCAHCKQYSLECTFFLPITETRFKKKKQAGKSFPPF
jgi:hypothetical protein